MEERKIEIGCILIAHDYYNEITNWYQVVDMKGKKTVVLELLEKKYISGGGLIHDGECMPVLDKPGTLINKTFRIRNNNSINIDNYVSAYLWNGEAGTYNYDN